MKYGKKFVVFAFGLSLAAAGCQNGENEMKEKATIEAGASAQKQTEVSNANLATKASEMESDLAVRHRFYQAVKGTYEGALETDQGEFKVKITLVPSLPPYSTSRTRQLDEIASDLNALHFNAQIVQWNPANKLSAVGCRIENIHADIVNGEINIASEGCANFYALRISESNMRVGSGVPTAKMSAELAAYVRDGKLDRISDIRGEVHPTTNAVVYKLSVSRITR